MNVSAWSKGKKQYGIRVGLLNRREYFDSNWREIIVLINDTPFTFSLTDGFWKEFTEFRDKGRPIKGQWLASQNLLNWPCGKPPQFIMKHIEDNHFALFLAL